MLQVVDEHLVWYLGCDFVSLLSIVFNPSNRLEQNEQLELRKSVESGCVIQSQASWDS